MNILLSILKSFPNVFLRKLYPFLIGIRDDKSSQQQGQRRDNTRRNHIGTYHPAKTGSRTQNGYDFTIVSHLGSKENNRNKCKQRRKHIREIRNEVEVIVKDNGVDRSTVLYKLLQTLRKVENDKRY